MKYMLDTNICSYIIKHRPLEVLDKFKSLDADDYCISSITYAELSYWVVRNKRLHMKSGNPGIPKINEQIIRNFTAHLEVLEFDAAAADVYADNRDCLEAQGVSIGVADLFIGSHAMSRQLVLVTNNMKEFKCFPHLQLENWVNARKVKQ